MAIVTCKYCNKKFDREKLPFVQIPMGGSGLRFRYAHPECYKDAIQNKIETGSYPIIDPTNTVLCFKCRLPLKKTDADCCEVAPGQYMHIQCWEQEKKKEKNPKEKLFDFLNQQCHTEFVSPAIQKQIDKLIEDNKFTYSGIHGTLKYWYVIKGNRIDIKNPIGIVPYIYKDAEKFFKRLSEVKEKNLQQLKQLNLPPDKIKIQRPVIPKVKTTEFSFLDEEELNG